MDVTVSVDVVVGERRRGLLLVQPLHLGLDRGGVRHARLVASPNRADVALPVNQQLRMRLAGREQAIGGDNVLVAVGRWAIALGEARGGTATTSTRRTESVP